MPFDIQAARSHADRVDPADPARLRDDIAELARPRMTGSDGAAAVEATLRSRFEALGYRTRPLAFSFSTWPGRFGLSLAGLLLAATGGWAGWLIHTGRPVLALVVLVPGLALTLAPLLLLERALDGLPWGRKETANLLFTRSDRPAWIVMAHRDTKSQLVPTLIRTAALGTGAVGWLVLVLVAALWVAVGAPFRLPALAVAAAALVVLAGLILALSWAGNRSPGALDNASGLAVLLDMARRTDGGEIAYLVTDGEELGLAGARAAVGALPPVQGVINLDGLDDTGRIWVAEGHGWRRQGSAPQLVAALLASARSLDVDAHRRPLPRTLPVDHVPIAAAGIPAVTVLRGDRRSLLRVHRPGDEAARMDGSGAAETATMLAIALRLLRATKADQLAGGRAHGHSPAT